MFYRRKIILALIERFGGEIEKLRLQKLLFLFSVKKEKPEYEFVPYKFGCYSYSAKADLNTMVKKGQLAESEKQYTKSTTDNFYNTVKPADQKIIDAVYDDYGSMSANVLIKHTYLNFPFYAIHSTIARDVLSGSLYERVEQARPKEDDIALFTIGYEGISLEGYLQKLIRNNVKLLLDVRKNPLSMKFGFSKTLLKRYCESLGIAYLHMPEVGIVSEKRKELKTQSDYDELFEDYRQTTLAENTSAQHRILSLLKEHRRIALTCFEAESCQCHRSHLAEAISELPEFEYSLIHL